MDELLALSWCAASKLHMRTWVGTQGVCGNQQLDIQKPVSTCQLPAASLSLILPHSSTTRLLLRFLLLLPLSPMLWFKAANLRVPWAQDAAIVGAAAVLRAAKWLCGYPGRGQQSLAEQQVLQSQAVLGKHQCVRLQVLVLPRRRQSQGKCQGSRVAAAVLGAAQLLPLGTCC
jgi:hypothetical protein